MEYRIGFLKVAINSSPDFLSGKNMIIRIETAYKRELNIRAGFLKIAVNSSPDFLS